MMPSPLQSRAPAADQPVNLSVAARQARTYAIALELDAELLKRDSGALCDAAYAGHEHDFSFPE